VGKEEDMKWNYPRRIAWWYGTDALKLVKYPPTSHRSWYVRIFLERMFWRLFGWLYSEHWACSDLVRSDLVRFGIDPRKIRLEVNREGFEPKKYKRINHAGFNVVYYRYISKKNQVFKDWLYGYDVIQAVERQLDLKGVVFLQIVWNEDHLDTDLDAIVPVTDLYIRPNRHDGESRLVMLFDHNNIPVYYTHDDIVPFHAKVEALKDVILKTRRMQNA
jgi:hypothetical protein